MWCVGGGSPHSRLAVMSFVMSLQFQGGGGGRRGGGGDGYGNDGGGGGVGDGFGQVAGGGFDNSAPAAADQW